jgi:hypothetical protein
VPSDLAQREKGPAGYWKPNVSRTRRETGLTRDAHDRLCAAVPRHRRLRDACLAEGISWTTVRGWITQGTMAGAPDHLAEFARDFCRADMLHQREMLELALRPFPAVKLKGVPAARLRSVLEGLPENGYTSLLRALVCAGEDAVDESITCDVTVEAPSKNALEYVNQRWPHLADEPDLMSVIENPGKRLENRNQLFANPPIDLRRTLTEHGWYRFQREHEYLLRSPPEALREALERAGWRQTVDTTGTDPEAQAVEAEALFGK